MEHSYVGSGSKSPKKELCSDGPWYICGKHLFVEKAQF